jgi:NAD(P)H dehydrogenase (quinone)
MLAITGASGQLGRLTIEQLVRHVDAQKIRAVTRNPESVTDLGVSTRAADFEDPASLATALDGVDRLLLISSNAFGVDGRRVRQHANAIAAAAQAGVGHVIYTSIARASDPGHPAGVAAEHRVTETALATSGLPYTVLRNSMYTQWLLAGAETTLLTGLLVDNSGDGATSYVTREDCAAVAAAVLARGGYEGERLEITGPRAVTGAEIAALFTEYTGHSVRYHPISDEETVAELMTYGMTEPVARYFVTIGRSIREGYTSLVTNVVERITGRKPTTVAGFLAGALRMS